MTDEGRQILYDEFCNEFSKLLVRSLGSLALHRPHAPQIAAFPERLNYYVMSCVEAFKSNWMTVRANGAVLVGFLLGNLSPEQRKSTTLNPAMAATALVLLLKEKSPDVRKKAAFALSLLTTY